MGDERRRSGTQADRRWWKRENWYRDVWLLLVTGLVLLTLSAEQGQVDSAHRTAARVAAAVRQIQRSRHEIAIDNCLAINARNRATRRKLTLVVAQIRDQAQRREANRNIAGTIALIDALAPRHHCEAYVAGLLAKGDK